MSKIVKVTAILLGIIALLIVTVAILLATLISPNRLKPILIDQIKKSTGRELIVDGNLSWTFFPYLGVKVGHMSLSNPANFPEKTFAEFNQATVGVKLMPLLHRQIESSGIVLSGMKLHLIKNADGKVNWVFPHKEITVKDSSTGATQNISNKKAMMGLAISGIDVTDATIIYDDKRLKKSYEIKQFQLQAKNISLTAPFPFKTSFQFLSSNPAASGQVTLTSTIALNLSKQLYSLNNLNISANVQQGSKKINMMLTGDVIADLNRQTVEWTKFKSTIANMTLLGKLHVENLKSQPLVTGNMQIEPFDLKETLNSIGEKIDTIQTAKTAKGNVDFIADANAVNVNTNMSIDTLQVAKLTLSNVNLKAHFQNGVLDLKPMTADLYQGRLAAEAQVNLNATLPQMTLHATLTNVQSEPLMQDLGGTNQKIKIVGLGNLELQITTAGSSSQDIMQHLNGMTRFSFNNGAITGLDLGYLVDTAAAYAKGQTPNATNNDRTNFGTLTGTGAIKNGVLTNNDLFSDAPRFATRGSGTIDLVNQKIDYTLQTTVKQQSNASENNLKNLYGISIPVIITGSLDKPSVRLDRGNLVKSAAKQKITDEISKRLPGEANKLLKGKAGDVLNNLLGH